MPRCYLVCFYHKGREGDHGGIWTIVVDVV